MSDTKIQPSQTDRTKEVSSEGSGAETPRFDPVITKISKPLKPHDVHAGATVGVYVSRRF